MNNQKNIKLLGGINLIKPKKEKNISSKNNNDNPININTFKMSEINVNKTSNMKNKSSNKNSFNKNSNRKQTSNSIDNRKSSKIFKIKKNKNNKIQLSLNLSEEESLNKNQYKTNNNIYNTINAINPRLKIFNKNDFVIKDINKKNKSIQNSSRSRYNNIRCNTYSNTFKENKYDYKYKSNKKEDRLKQNNNNIIINFFNAPINKYNEEFYFNNINDMNKIIKNKQIKKKVLNIFNHGSTRVSHNDNINNIKNMYPIFSSNNYNINNYHDFEFQIYQNKKKTISNGFDNLRTIFDSRSIRKMKKSPNYKETLDNYSNRYQKIKFIKNKKTKNLSLNIKGENKLKTIFKRTKNNNSINAINKNNNIINIKQDHFIRSKTLKTEHKTKNKHILYNLLFKSNLKTEQNNSYKNKSKNLKNILSFNRLNTFKSIDVERNTRKIPKFETLVTEVYNNINTKKNNKNKFLKKSKVPIYINNNIQYHQNKNMKTIFNSGNHSINTKNNILKVDKKTNENKKLIRPNFIKVIDNNLINNSDIESESENDKQKIIINKDPKYLGEYLDEILCNLFLEEKHFMEKVGFQISSDILNSYGINPETRTCLIDSLIDLQKIFNFKERTLFITVQLFDRYIALSIIKEITPKLKEENLDIILTSALLIASKIEESILYKLSDYLGILSEKYTIEDIKVTENKIMNLMDFSAVSPTVLDFFEILAEKSELNEDQKNRGLFLLNTILLDINLSQISGSVIAYAVVKIVQENNNKNNNKSLIEILNLVNKSKNKNNVDNLDAVSLMNNEEKMDELCNLIQVFAEGILKTEYNHISEKFNCQNNDYISKLKTHPSI